MRDLVAQSISRSVRAGLISGAEAPWQVLAVFDRACDLVTPRGDVMAIVLPAIGDGPLNVVVEGEPGTFRTVRPGMPATLQGTHLQVGVICVEISQVRIWEPCPAWDRLRPNSEQIQGQLPVLARLALQHSPRGSLLDCLFETWGRPDFLRSDRAGCAAFQQALPDLRAGWDGDPERLRRGAAQLAGLGSGLTPAGDDFLVGAMLRAWLTHPQPRSLCLELVEVAATRTTTLSAALLQAAARGECSAPWHALLAALNAGDQDLDEKVKGVLSYGHTSGADTLAGFLFCNTA